jgi:hypothetical protein
MNTQPEIDDSFSEQPEINAVHIDAGAPARTRGCTGPRTARGKERSKRNAVKHGIFSKIIVLPDESKAEFDSLLKGLHEDFQPVGTLEEILVEKLATLLWRNRRFLIAEGAEIRAGVVCREWDEKQRQLVEAGRISQVYCNGGLVRKIANPEALQRCLDLLQEVKLVVERVGFCPEHDQALLTILYGTFEDKHWENTLFNSYVFWSQAASTSQDVREKGELSSPQECQKEFLKELSREMKRLETYKRERSSIESRRMELESLRRNVPESPRLDQLLRYSASLERTFDRTLTQLERLQRIRCGQHVPLPVEVNVSSS